MVLSTVSASTLLEGGIDYYELFHYLWACAAFIAIIGAGIVMYFIVSELDKP